MMSEPRRSWMSRTSSGVRKSFEPSRWEAKATPSRRTLASGAEAVDLETAAVGQDGLRPGDEGVQPAHGPDGLRAGTEKQVVGIAEDQMGAEGGDLVMGQALDRALAGDGGEGRRGDVPVGRLDQPGPGRGSGGGRLDDEIFTHSREPEIDDVAVPDGVVFALETKSAGLLGLSPSSPAKEFLEGDDFGPDETLLDVGVDRPRGLEGRAVAPDRPGPDFIFSDRVEHDLVEKAQGLGKKPGRGRFSESVLLQENGRSVSSSISRISRSIFPQKARTAVRGPGRSRARSRPGGRCRPPRR